MWHASLKKSWSLTPPPEGYPLLVAIRFQNYWSKKLHWQLDYARIDNADENRLWYAHESIEDVRIEWPWQENMQPTPADWRQIGFRYIEALDMNKMPQQD